ncbi:MAG: alpha/beta fold hydrolase [Granulosicoccus sp.]
MAVFLTCCHWVIAADDKPLSFDFTRDAPGEKIMIDGFRLHVDCLGEGETTVLFEAGLGGSSIEWKPIQESLSQRVRACIYDRAGYAWSDPAPFPRHAREMARESDILLSEIGADGPLILVGHSFGGFIIRELSLIRRQSMIGMILIDASHEDQLLRLEAAAGKSMMPKGDSFVVSPIEVPESLPENLRRKIQAFSRMRKTYSALHSEMTYFRQSAQQVKRDRVTVDYPLIVVSRGLDLYAKDKQGVEKTAIWKQLQSDLALLSTDSKLVIAENSGHHVHTEQPQLIVEQILSILDSHKQSQTGSEQ